MSNGYKGSPVNSILFIILSFLCYVPYIYWQYLIVKDINNYLGKEVVGIPLAILGALCWPINIYVWLTLAKAVPELRQKAGLPAKDDSVILIVLGIIIAPVAAFLVQEELNKIWGTTAA